MRQFRLVNEQGLFIEDVLLDEAPDDIHYIETQCQEGFYHPKWDFENLVWIEGGSAPEESSESIISRLKIELASTDYKIIKCSEYQLIGLELPYDLIALHEERQAIRDSINELECN